MDMCRAAEIVSQLTSACVSSCEEEQGDSVPRFSPHTVHSVLLSSLWCHVFRIL